jgi:hypothetical protein
MKKYILTIIIIITTQVSADTIIESTYFNNKTLNWNKAGSPYIINGHLTLSSTTLNIDDAKIIIRNGSIGLYNNSTVNANDISIENTTNFYVFSVFNSKVFLNNINSNSDKLIEAYTSDIKINNLTSLLNGDKDFISLYNNSDFSLENSNIQNYKGDVLNIYSVSTAQVKNTEFINNTRVFGIHSANSLLVNNNDFQQNKVAIQSYITGGNFEDNYFQKENPVIYAYKEDAPINENDILAGAFSIQLFSKVKNIKTPETCCSNIMFLPGVMGSRLYITETVDNQLWEPNRNTDVKKLYLDEFGKSINNIFTKDIIVKTNIFGGLPNIDKDIYKDFDDYLKKIKTQKIINDYNSVPYDWRMSADYILDQGVKYKDKNIDLVQVVEDLQKTSKTGKVTLITHSNGGIVAKQLVLELQKIGLETAIDKIVFVAMPEYGTAQAITALMFGHNQSLAGGLIMRSSIARELAKNMPTAYTLLPSEKYYTYNIHADKLLQETVIRNYSRVNTELLNKSKSLHQELDNMTYPENINVHQILGTGINTLSDIKLDDKNMFKIIPLYTKAGDGVVQDLYLSRGNNVTFIDLKDTIYKHVNIMNNDKVISTIANIIKPSKVDIPGGGLDYYKIIKDNNYKLLKISPSNPNNKLSEYLTPLDMELSIGISKIKDNIDNELYFDKFSASTNNIFREVREHLNNNRFELYDDSIHYLYTTDIENFSIKPKVGNTIDISIIESIDGDIQESEYKNIEIFKDSELIFDVNNESNSLNISLPTTGGILKIENSNPFMIVPEISTDEKINKIIAEIKSSNMDFYLKDRYIRRVEVYRQNKDAKYLQTLKARTVSSIDSIAKLSYSPTLRSRYAKLKEYYILLNFLLLKL